MTGSQILHVKHKRSENYISRGGVYILSPFSKLCPSPRMKGPWNRGCNIPISRFQNDNILAFHLNIQYSNFKMPLSYAFYRTHSPDRFDILISFFQCLISNIQISNWQYPLFLKNIQYPVFGVPAP